MNILKIKYTDIINKIMSDNCDAEITEPELEQNNVDYKNLFSMFEKFMFALHPQINDFQENLKKSKKSKNKMSKKNVTKKMMIFKLKT